MHSTAGSKAAMLVSLWPSDPPLKSRPLWWKLRFCTVWRHWPTNCLWKKPFAGRESVVPFGHCCVGWAARRALRLKRCKTFSVVDLLQVKRLLVRDWLLKPPYSAELTARSSASGLLRAARGSFGRSPLPLVHMMINTDTLEIFWCCCGFQTLIQGNTNVTNGGHRKREGSSRIT